MGGRLGEKETDGKKEEMSEMNEGGREGERGGARGRTGGHQSDKNVVMLMYLVLSTSSSPHQQLILSNPLLLFLTFFLKFFVGILFILQLFLCFFCCLQNYLNTTLVS